MRVFFTLLILLLLFGALPTYASDGWLTKVVNSVYTEAVFKYFEPYPECFGGIGNTNRYTTSVGNTAGTKLRSPTAFPLPQTISVMGFDALPIDWSDVYTSLQTGVVDGDFGNVISACFRLLDPQWAP